MALRSNRMQYQERVEVLRREERECAKLQRREEFEAYGKYYEFPL